MTAEIRNQSKTGNKNEGVVYGLDRETVAEITPGVFDNGDGGYSFTANKRELAAIERAIARANDSANKIRAAEPKRASKSRYIESYERAELYGLNHGRAWVCREIDVETKGASPEWEGSLICYVYED